MPPCGSPNPGARSVIKKRTAASTPACLPEVAIRTQDVRVTTSAKRPTEAWHSSDLFATGFGEVIITRFKASGEAEIGVFLLDVFCLGVKNAFFSRLWAREYEQRLLEPMTQREGKTSLSPAGARKLVEGAVAYARTLGIEPHPDYKHAARVFGGINPAEHPQEFVYGDKGKPLFVQGPNDSPQFVERVMSTLVRRLGEGGFHYILSVGQSTDFDADPAPDEEPAGPDQPAGSERN